MEDFDKYLDRLVENFYDTGKLVLNEWSDLFYHNNQYPQKLWVHLQDLKKSGDDAVKIGNKKVAIEKYGELLDLYDDDKVMDDNDRHNILTHRYNSIDIEEVRYQLKILTSPESEEEEEVSSSDFSNIKNKVPLFYRTFTETSKLFKEGIWGVMCDSDNGTQEECFNKIKTYIGIVNIWYGNLIPLLDEMNEAELESLSRGGDNEFRFFNNKRWSNNNKIDVLLKEMGKMYMDELRKTYQFALNKIHDLTKKNEDEETELSDVELSIDYYRELKNIISIMSSQLPYKNKIDWNRRIDGNIFNNIRSKIIFKITENADFQGLVDLSNELREIIDGADDKLIEFIIERLKRTSYVKKMMGDYNLPMENREDIITWLSKFRQKQYFKQFEEVVRDIEPEEIEDNIWDDNLVPLLNDFIVDDEELNTLVDLINQKENKLNDLKSIRDSSNDINQGKVQIPELEILIPQLKEQLKLIDPIKEFFDSNSDWKTYLRYCKEISGVEYKEINDFLTKKYGSKYQNVLNITVEPLETNTFLKSQTKDIKEIGENCKSKTFIKLMNSLKLKNNRETLHNELISNFEENHELVWKCIRLVDQIFMSIVQNRVYEQNQQQKLLKKYKSYINMIKIYSEGENQKEKLSQLVYDLNQLKGVVDSYDSLRDEAIPVDAEGDENDGRNVKLLTKNTLRNLLKNISFNSWDANEIKEYFVAVREHKNVAYEKSFEKKCENQQYFERVGGGNNPAIVSGNNNITLVNELLKKDDNDNLLPVSAVTETIFGKVRELLDRENLEDSKLKKYDIKTTQNVTLTPYNREGENITIVGNTFIEVKDAKPGDYHFSEFFGVYKNKKETNTAYNTITTSGDPEQNKARYEQFVEELVYLFNNNEGETIINTIKNRIGGIFFENYLFAHIDDITFSWSPTGQGTSRENRVSIRVIPDMNKLYYWKEGNSNCGNQFKYPNCETDSGCPQNESTDRLDNIIENFFDTGNFDI